MCYLLERVSPEPLHSPPLPATIQLLLGCPGLKQRAVHSALFAHQGSELGTQTLLQPAELGHKEEMVPEDLGVLSHVIRTTGL